MKKKNPCRARCLAAIMVILIVAAVTIDCHAQNAEWVRRYYGAGVYDHTGRDIAVDSGGNVIVTGKSFDSNSGYDYATVKYSPDGNEVWVSRYDGPVNRNDEAHALTIDDFNNIYVTGVSDGNGTGDDYATVKYEPNGNQLWVARYHGPTRSGTDQAYAIAVDALGCVYVTGASHGGTTNHDYATIKYEPNGNELWVARYNGPASQTDEAYDIAVDGSGNVYVTGLSDGGSTNNDYATIKYAPDGNEVWVVRYSGVVSYGGDAATALAIDNLGGVHVTGSSYSTETHQDYVTIKYDADSNDVLWVSRYAGPGDQDTPTAIEVDDACNVFVTGYSRDDRNTWDYATVKYEPNGNELWVARYDGTGRGNDIAEDLAVDIEGNVYVTGRSRGKDLQFILDYLTIKYEPNGSELWVARYNPAKKHDGAYAIAVDESGVVYVTGSSICDRDFPDYATIKYDQCLDRAAPEYDDWVAWGMPDCWCYPRQCRGDADGIQTGPFWVAIPDLNFLRPCINIPDDELPDGCICADFDHLKTGPFRVAIPDLNILRLYINQPDANMPQCDEPPIYTGPYNFTTSP